MNPHLIATALLASLLTAVLVIPQLGGPLTSMRSAIASYRVIAPAPAAAPFIRLPTPGDDIEDQAGAPTRQGPGFAGPGPGWG